MWKERVPVRSFFDSGWMEFMNEGFARSEARYARARALRAALRARRLGRRVRMSRQVLQVGSTRPAASGEVC